MGLASIVAFMVQTTSQARLRKTTASDGTACCNWSTSVANEGQAAPDISSAALFAASQMARDLGDSPTADKLIQQLRQEFPQTYHARAMAGSSESIERSQQ